jgi:hypothetical protein
VLIFWSRSRDVAPHRFDRRRGATFCSKGRNDFGCHPSSLGTADNNTKHPFAQHNEERISEKLLQSEKVCSATKIPSFDQQQNGCVAAHNSPFHEPHGDGVKVCMLRKSFQQLLLSTE